MHTLFECASEMARVAQVKWRMFAGASVQVNKFFIEINLRQQQREIVVDRRRAAQRKHKYTHTHMHAILRSIEARAAKNWVVKDLEKFGMRYCWH